MVTKVMCNDQSRSDAKSAAARKIRVVLVDDSALFRAVLIRLLESCSHVQIAGQAQDGLDGFALASRLQPDLVITDLQMPGRDGLELVELLRQSYPAMRSIITSSHEGPICHAASLQHGADAFIIKRCLFDELPRLLSLLFPETTKPATAISQE